MSEIALFEDDFSIVIPRSAPSAQRNDLKGGIAAFNRLRPLIPLAQAKAVSGFMRDEEGQFFIDKMVELSNLVDAMPVTYQQSEDPDPTAYLHYFHASGSDWYITEKDIEGEVHQCFGYAILHGDLMCAEYGYISIAELVALPGWPGVEMDFHFNPTRMSEVRKLLERKYGDHD